MWKKFLVISLMVLCFTTPALAADVKITALPAASAIAGGTDLFLMVDMSGAGVTKKISVTDLFASIPAPVATTASNGNNHIGMANNTSEPSCSGAYLHSMHFSGASDAAAEFRVCVNGTAKIPVMTTTPTPLGTGTSCDNQTGCAIPKGYYICTGACSITLPTPAAGYEFCVMNDNNVTSAITLEAITNVYFENTNRTSYIAVSHHFKSSGAAGDKICVIGLDSTHYLTPSFTGTWAESDS